VKKVPFFIGTFFTQVKKLPATQMAASWKQADFIHSLEFKTDLLLLNCLKFPFFEPEMLNLRL